VPNFFIVGSPKTGTTSLYEMLRGHPQIYMPDLKEPRFLASDMRPRPELAGEPRESGYPTTLADYLTLFDEATPAQCVGEASTFYLWSHTAARNIAELQPEARIVAILREPASFLRSMHLMFLRWGIEGERDLRKAMALEAARSEGRQIPRHSHRPQLLQYSEHVRYMEQLRRYQDHFRPERMLVLIYEDFHRENEATVRQVMRFLDVDDQAPVDVMNVNVTTRTVRSWRAKHLLRSIARGRSPIARSTRATVKTLTTRGQRRRVTSTIRSRVVTADAPPYDERFMIELRRRFKPEVVALGEYLDRDLVSLWGYDELS
jgi:hypothetical protein